MPLGYLWFLTMFLLNYKTFKKFRIIVLRKFWTWFVILKISKLAKLKWYMCKNYSSDQTCPNPWNDIIPPHVYLYDNTTSLAIGQVEI